MPLSEFMLLGALETIEAIYAARSQEAIAAAVTLHAESLGASFALVVQVSGDGGATRSRAIVDTSPQALSFIELEKKYPDIANIAGQFVGGSGVVRDARKTGEDCPPDLMKVGTYYVRHGAVATFVGVPLYGHEKPAGYGLYCFATPPAERDALDRVVRFVCQAALNQFEAITGETSDAPATPLTRRQREVLAQVVDGKSDGEIAAALGVSQNTVHEHIEEAKRRIGVRTRVQAAVIAARNGWVSS